MSADDWKRLGFVEGVLWIGHIGLTLRFHGPKVERFRASDATLYRLWPFLLVHAD